MSITRYNYINNIIKYYSQIFVKNLFCSNVEYLGQAFAYANAKHSGSILDRENLLTSYKRFLEKNARLHMLIRTNVLAQIFLQNIMLLYKYISLYEPSLLKLFCRIRCKRTLQLQSFPILHRVTLYKSVCLSHYTGPVDLKFLKSNCCF